MTGPERASTYVTPKTPRQAVLNALSELEERQVHDIRGQLDVILYHLKDFHFSRIAVAKFRKMTLEEFARDFVMSYEDGEEPSEKDRAPRPEKPCG